jgi:sulfoquinovose isomerase
MAPAIGDATLGNWTTRTYHRDWLIAQANGLFDFLPA